MKSNPFARRLLALLGFLPAGLPERIVVRLLGDRGMVSKAKAHEATSCLHQLRLVEKRLDGRLRMLTPLRESVRNDVSPLSVDKKRLIDQYLELATKASAVGGRDWEKVRAEVEEEADNLDPICEIAFAANVDPFRLDRALTGLAHFHIFSGRAAVSSLSAVLTSDDGKIPPLLIASCTQNLGEIARAHADNEMARARYEDALTLFQRNGNVWGEANCIQSLGKIARVRSNHETARARFEEALTLYRRIGSVLGEALCIEGLGDIALARSDHETARARYDEALTLNRRIGDMLGEANCIQSLGEIASARSDHETARARYDEALTLFRRIGGGMGEANCILGLGDVATARSDLETARARYDEGLVLYRRVGDMLGEANCIRRLGDLANARSDLETARARYAEALALYRCIRNTLDEAITLVRSGQATRKLGDASGGLADIEEGFALLFKNADTEDRAVDGWRALHRALTCDDPLLAGKHREDAGAAWAAIERFDLVRDWIERD